MVTCKEDAVGWQLVCWGRGGEAWGAAWVLPVATARLWVSGGWDELLRGSGDAVSSRDQAKHTGAGGSSGRLGSQQAVAAVSFRCLEISFALGKLALAF